MASPNTLVRIPRRTEFSGTTFPLVDVERYIGVVEDGDLSLRMDVLVAAGRSTGDSVDLVQAERVPFPSVCHG